MECNKIFIVKFPCIYKGGIICSDCDNSECDMREGRELHRKLFRAGYESGKKFNSDRLRIFLEALEMRQIDDIMENADCNDMKILGKEMAITIKNKVF